MARTNGGARPSPAAPTMLTALERHRHGVESARRVAAKQRDRATTLCDPVALLGWAYLTREAGLAEQRLAALEGRDAVAALDCDPSGNLWASVRDEFSGIADGFGGIDAERFGLCAAYRRPEQADYGPALRRVRARLDPLAPLPWRLLAAAARGLPGTNAADDDVQSLLGAFDRFRQTLGATTTPDDKGGRTVTGIPHAVALSEATTALYQELSATQERLVQQHGQPTAGHSPGLTFLESDSLDGPWTPIPASAIKGATMGIGGGGADAVLLAAVESAERVAASPIEKWNAMQAAQPGANHQRFHAGDVVSAADLAALRSAATLLRMAGVGRVIESLGAPDDNDTKSKTLPAVADEPTGPALTPSQSRVLKIMARFDRSQLVSTDRIVAEMDPARPLSDETVRLSVKKLIDSGLAERPEGDRSGARLTPSGRTLCGKIAD